MENIENNKAEVKQVKNFKSLKIVTAILYAIATIFSIIFMIDIISQPTNIGTAFALVLWIILAGVALAIPLIIGLVGLIISAVKIKKGLCTKASVVYFSIFTALPIITFLASILIFNIVL